jgi:hypothetical protein
MVSQNVEISVQEKINFVSSCYYKMGHRTVKSESVIFQCAPLIMSCLYGKSQKYIHLLYSHIRKLLVPIITVKCVYLLFTAFISLCHQLLAHVHEEPLFMWGSLFYLQSTASSNERMDTTSIPRILWTWPNLISVPHHVGAWVAQTVQCLATDWMTGQFNLWQGPRILLLDSARLALGPTQPPIH